MSIDPTNPPEGTPTQVAHPGKATLRTAVANAVGVLVVAAVVLPLVSDIVEEELGQYLPDGWQAWLAGISAAIVALSAAVTRILAIPALQPWLTKVGLGTGVERERGRHAAR